MDYKNAYYFLFNQVTDLIQSLKAIQLQAEEICISDDEEEE